MKFRAVQSNFSRGELAPELRGRFDADAYQASLKLARNVFILKYGGVSKRPGTRLVGEIVSKDDVNRLLPFEFSTEQTYALELGQGYMAPCALGGRVLEAELAITNISSASNAQVSATFHGYSVGDKVWLEGIEGVLGDLLNGRCWEVLSVVDADNFTINADATGIAFTSSSGGEERATAPDADPTPPTVPPPVQPEPPPDVGGSGGDAPGGFDPDRNDP